MQLTKSLIYLNELFVTHHRSTEPSLPAAGDHCLYPLLTGWSCKGLGSLREIHKNVQDLSPCYKTVVVSHVCCLKYPIALAFITLRACYLQLQNLFLKSFRQCFPDSLWQYFSLIVFMLLFLCCYFHGHAPANPGRVVKTGPHGKQLPLLWELTSSPPFSLPFGL